MRQLYEHCSLCYGKGPEHQAKCPGCRGEKFLPIGLTAGQVERMAAAESRRRGDPAFLPSGNNYLPVPVEAARAIANEFRKDVVIVIAVDRAHGQTHSTSYGRRPEEKEWAARLSEECMKTIGCDLSKATTHEDFRFRPEAETARLIEDLTTERDALKKQLEAIEQP